MRNPRGVGERPMTALGAAFVLTSRVRIATVEGTPATGNARLFAESGRNGGLGRSGARGGSPPFTFAAPATAGVPWPPRRGTSSAYAFKRRTHSISPAPSRSVHRGHVLRSVQGHTSGSRVREPGFARSSRARRPSRPARANLLTQEEPRGARRIRRRCRGGSPLHSLRDSFAGRESARKGVAALVLVRTRRAPWLMPVRRVSLQKSSGERLVSDKPACPASKKGHRRGWTGT
jgi:hypothetical protein